MKRTPVAIVGAGPTGLSCGIALKQRGVDAVMFDKGCVVNSIYNYPTNMSFFTTPELLEIGGLPMTSLNEKPNRTEALKYYRRVSAYYNLQVRQYERVDAVDGRDGEFVLSTTTADGAAHRYSCDKVILATGYYDIPVLLDVPGEKLPKVIHYYKEPHPYFDQDVLVVGGKNSAVIAALELHWSGARVTFVHRGEGLSDSVKYWLKPNLENRIKSGEIKAYFRSRVLEIFDHKVHIETPDGAVTLPNDFVFAMTGYKPDLKFLASVGITLDKGTGKPRLDPETFESATPGIYLAGVLVAGMHTNEVFIENGRFHGDQIARDIAVKLGAAPLTT